MRISEWIVDLRKQLEQAVRLPFQGGEQKQVLQAGLDLVDMLEAAMERQLGWSLEKAAEEIRGVSRLAEQLGRAGNAEKLPAWKAAPVVMWILEHTSFGGD